MSIALAPGPVKEPQDMADFANKLLSGPIVSVGLIPTVDDRPVTPKSALDWLADDLLKAVRDARVIDGIWARKTVMALINRWYREIGR